VVIKVGNTLPQVAINASSNTSFFFPKASKFNYKIEVKDNEDKVIDKKKIKVDLNFIAKVQNNQSLVGHQEITPTYNYGKSLIAGSDCKACHQVNALSVGPSFIRIAKRYATDKAAVDKLSNKIINGGGGVWGEHAMSAHPQISKDDASEIVKYILSLGVKKANTALPAQGSAILDKHLAAKDQGRYIFSASYTDNGGAITPLTKKEALILRPSKVQAEDADVLRNVDKSDKQLGSIHNGSYFGFKNIDLKDINKLTYLYSSLNRNGSIEVHIDSPKGPIVSKADFTATGAWAKYQELSAPVSTTATGRHDLYFVIVKDTAPNQHLISIDWISFSAQ
jgi:cytochrome c